MIVHYININIIRIIIRFIGFIIADLAKGQTKQTKKWTKLPVILPPGSAEPPVPTFADSPAPLLKKIQAAAAIVQ